MRGVNFILYDGINVYQIRCILCSLHSLRIPSGQILACIHRYAPCADRTYRGGSMPYTATDGKRQCIIHQAFVEVKFQAFLFAFLFELASRASLALPRIPMEEKLDAALQGMWSHSRRGHRSVSGVSIQPFAGIVVVVRGASVGLLPSLSLQPIPMMNTAPWLLANGMFAAFGFYIIIFVSEVSGAFDLRIHPHIPYIPSAS